MSDQTLPLLRRQCLGTLIGLQAQRYAVWDAILRRQFWYWVLPLCLGDHDLFDGLVHLRDFMVGDALLGNPYLVQ